jgi:hypothetical protein
MGDEGNRAEGIRTPETDGRRKPPAALTFSRLIDLFPPHFHSAADDVGCAKGNILGEEKKAGHILFQTSDPPNV